ncbi:P-loop NTPase family protein [Chryseobacterium shandongense]|uniref:DEAD/DEAH box helicase family protein n=1 Tax=Chryseobacterium shandongense TaxID=1493872 RepID=UPI000F50CB50|nr:DEAD/DEAH box helicase family protein [Chryseobacterium shandongense]AZA56976.1 hypothetical protein EG350_07225 [Chryseobacterium shandongense]
MPEIKKVVKEIEKQLKTFQSASVDYVMEQFYKKRRNKVLIADEVGLGKTIIAKGVIAKSVDKKRKGKAFHVVYICSNQVLASQNISKLNPFGKSEQPLNRLLFLAINPQINNNLPLRLSSLTPNTSFNITRSTGYKEERAIIFKLLIKYADFNQSEKELSKLLRGNHRISTESWNSLIGNYKNKQEYLRPELAKAFKEKLESLPFSITRFPKAHALLGNREYKSFYSGLTALIRKFAANKEIDPLSYSFEIIVALRKELTQLCVKYLDADLFILDEFQKFKSLIDGDDFSEASEIAKAVLQDDEARVLLLSATPFKPYTTQRDQLNSEDHHDEFRKIVTFLGGKKGEKLWQGFRNDQQAFFEILRFPKSAIEEPVNAFDVKTKLEDSFKTFLSRNERLNVAKDYDNMIAKNTVDQISVINQDVANFIAIDKLTDILRSINPLITNRFGSTLEFAKSAPYPLSFLRGYNLYDLFDNYKDEPKIKSFLKKNANATIPYEKINNYKPFGFHKGEPTYPNGKLRVLAEECFNHSAELLLWIPPSKPYYIPFGCYEKASDFSKILVFSNWLMAPRAISTLLSYEVERRTIGSDKSKSSLEKGKRSYFSQPRKPVQQITYNHSSSDKKVKYDATNSILTYPGKVLSEINVLKDIKNYSQKYSEIKKIQTLKIRQLFEELEIKKSFVSFEKEDEKWYWVASPLLDVLKDPDNSILDKIAQSHSGNKKALYQYLKKTINDVLKGTEQMGKFPNDLFSVLSDITLSSPANACILALDNNFKNDDTSSIFSTSHSIADAFISLLNKPESIAAIRIAALGNEYWKQVLQYSASGNISSMFEEYFYMLRNCNNTRTVEEIMHLMIDVLTVSTSSINVDLQNKNGELQSYSMRCHFAANFGDENIGTESGSNRSVNVRTVFNSPFRPFVLASTSIGQEGLDFHFYCRKIFHWNLPHNAIDIEQREGRINRFKGFVIRKKLAELISDEEIEKYNNEGSVWSALFACGKELNVDDNSGIKPYWYLDSKNNEEQSTMIERFVPIHKYSKDQNKYEQLKATLGLYRLTFGQPRQEELIEAFKESQLTNEEIDTLRKTLLINLSPLKEV